MTNSGQEKNNIIKGLLSKIKSGEVKMRPKYYFVLRGILFASAFVVLFLFMIFLAGFIVFYLRISGVWFLPRFGLFGIKILFSSLPWFLIVLSLILIVTLELFAGRISFIYKRPLIYSLVSIIVIVLVVGLIIGFTSFHTNLFFKAQTGKLPIIGPVYKERFILPDIQNVHHGVIYEIRDNSLFIENPRGEILEVIGGDFNIINENIKIGVPILVVGERTGNVIQARFVKIIEEDLNFFPSGRGIKMLPPPPGW